MNLIRNTLMVVAFLQLLGFLYIKFIHQENKQTSTTNKPSSFSTFNQKMIDNIVMVTVVHDLKTKKKELPLSTQYTDTLKVASSKTKVTKKSNPICKVYKNTTKTSTYAKIESYAKKFLGHKYVWGATGPKTFDCSGFTQKIYRKTAGINLPRVSKEQAQVGTYVKYNRLKQGDMVFFDTSKEHTGEVNHVGIYLGKNNFIHASSGKKAVVITNFNKKKFYKNRFLWGRRVLKEQSNEKIAALLQKKISDI
ncbi:C40 family peptidase [bacterium]|nr:C40 family peptidase [bacterium]MBU1957325.1 C40 family peptidase [bacterium]